ncbi:MAG: hypothetical protein ABSG68_17845 [Thermoguttaceae bacterium]
MSFQRIFLDWRRPCLAAAAEYLAERFAAARALELDNVVLAVPGSRAGRRLLELLVDLAEGRKWRFCPPRIITVGALPELLYAAKQPFAGDLVQQLAWVEALRRGEPQQLAALVSAGGAESDLAARLALAQMLAGLHRELAAEAMNFAAVADCGARLEGFREAARWRVLAALQQQYLLVLDALGLWDRQTARLYALQHGEFHSNSQIILVGTADLNRSQRLMLDQIADQVTALVFAPPHVADRFDEHGCLRPAAWLEAKTALAAEQIEVVEDPAEQAEAVLRAVARLHGRYRAEQISIGVPDEQLVPYLLQRLRQGELPARYGVGVPILRSGPCRLLAAAGQYLENSRFAAFAALLRHPDIERWLAERKIVGDWLTQLDQYHAEHAPYRVDGHWLGTGAGIVARVHREVEQLCRPLRGDGAARPLHQWTEPLAELLLAVFGSAPLDPAVEYDRAVLAGCQQIRNVLDEWVAVPPELSPRVTSPEAIALLLRQLGGQSLAPPSDRNAIELLGWLELPWDDAPALVVTGFNEGRVPSSLNADLFLPNQLRQALGIEDNQRRYARDAYALGLLAASRQDLHVIAGRRTAEADPLLPSRLLLACDDDALPGRVTAFFSHDSPLPLRRTGGDEEVASHDSPLPSRERGGGEGAGFRWRP